MERTSETAEVPQPSGVITVDTGEWMETAHDRGTIVFTLLLDTLIIITAIAVRWLIVVMSAKLAPAGQQNFVVTWLERLSDYGMILTAAVFTTFDLGKVIVRSAKSFLRVVRGEGR